MSLKAMYYVLNYALGKGFLTICFPYLNRKVFQNYHKLTMACFVKCSTKIKRNTTASAHSLYYSNNTSMSETDPPKS